MVHMYSFSENTYQNSFIYVDIMLEWKYGRIHRFCIPFIAAILDFLVLIRLYDILKSQFVFIIIICVYELQKYLYWDHIL